MTLIFGFSISIVEKLRGVGLVCLIVAYLLLLMPGNTYATDMKTHLTSEVLDQWISLGGNRNNAEISFPNNHSSLILPGCKDLPQVSFINGLHPGRNGIQARCESPFWQQTMAIELHVFEYVLVLQSQVKSKSEIPLEDIKAVRLDVSGLHGQPVTDASQIQGMLAKRNLKSGTALTLNLLEPKDIVKRGQMIKAIKSRGSIRVEITGIALANGHQGELIRIRNERSGQVMRAEVMSADLVQIQ